MAFLRGRTPGQRDLVRRVDHASEGAGPGGVGSADSEDCEAPALVPKAGTWRVSNFAGQMVCGSMINMPLIEDKLALRMVAYGGKDAGYIDNIFGNTPGRIDAGAGMLEARPPPQEQRGVESCRSFGTGSRW